MPFCPVDADVALTPDDVAGSAPRPSLADAKLLSPPPRAADGALLAPVEPPNWEALAEALLPPPRRGALLRDGFAVVDGALGDGYASALRSELLGLVAAGGLRPNRTAFAGAAGAALVYSKPGVVEADLHDPALAQSLLCGGGLPALAAWFAASAGEFVDALSARLPALRLERGPRARAVKLASSSRGSAFPLHYDNPGPPCRRALTLLLYLNPDWAPGDGGELVLQPFLGAAQSVPPLHGRFVLFLADRLLHRTLPSACPRRLCVTTWFDGGATNSDSNVRLRLPASAMADVPATAAALRSSPAQRSVSRAVYAAEYERSLRDCMGGADGEAALLAAHGARVAEAAANPPLAKLVAALAAIKAPG